MCDKKRLKIFGVLGRIALGIVVAALFSVVSGALVMVLWNWLMPAIFGLGVITYWQGFGLALLAKLFFGGFFGHGKPPGHDWHHHAKGKNWRVEFRHKINHANGHFDDAYEDWWKKEGSKSFDEYMNKKE